MSESSIDSSFLKQLEPQVVKIAEAAGHEILSIYASGFTVQDKADHTPLTEADLAAHNIIKAGLETLGDQFPVLSEEEVISFEQRQGWTTYWLVDPLDGTKEFIKRNGEFSVNIALIHQNKAVLGVVFAPVLETTYVASHGNGAYKSDQQKSAVKMQVSKVSEVLRITASRSHPGPRTQAYLGKLSETLGAHSFVPMGSSLKSCIVADGLADLYPRFGKTSEWDTAACQVIVEEAGGVMQTMQGEPIRYNSKESLLNPEFMVFGDSSVDWVGIYNKVIKQ